MSHIQNLWEEDNKTNIDKNRNCCGCEVCACVCPVGAIKMLYDKEGFLYPKVDEEMCIECGACVRTCPNCVNSVQEKDYIATCAGYSTDEEIMNNCTSGGFVTEVSKMFVQEGGIVYGVEYDSDYIHSQYTRADSVAGLKALMGSKYVQAEKYEVYNQVKTDVQSGGKVLFVGCPCDVAALKNYLKQEYDNLYTCELVCMGVTSYKIAEDYKRYTEEKNKSKLIYINARSKKRGWFVPQLEEQFENGAIKSNTLFGTYYGYGFQTYNRPSCYQCHFRGKNGVADFRVGDFWGIKKTDPYWNPEGVSCIFVRTLKGQKVLEELQSKGFQVFETDYDTATMNNMSSRINKPLKYQVLREKFAQEYEENGLIAACKATETFAVKVKRMAPQKLQWVLKRVYHMIRDTR